MTRLRFIDAAATLLFVRAMVIVLGFSRTLRTLEHRAFRIHSGSNADRPTLEAVAQTVSAAAVMLPGRIECLEQSLTLWYVLRRRGIDVDLVFGMRQYPFRAHAWVSFHGEPLNEDREGLSQYVAFA